MHHLLDAGRITHEVIPGRELVELVHPGQDGIVCNVTVQQQGEQGFAVAVLTSDGHAQHHGYATQVGSKFSCVGRVGQDGRQLVDAFPVVVLKCSGVADKIELIGSQHYLSPPYSTAR